MFLLYIMNFSFYCVKPDCLYRIDILKKLFRVFESSLKVDPEESYYKQVDPDDTYALTYDNLVKMLAIQMRFR